MKFFENKVLNFSDTERSILGRIIAEARNCFSSPMDDPYLEQMKKKENIPFGAQQLLILYKFTLFCVCRNLRSMSDDF